LITQIKQSRLKETQSKMSFLQKRGAIQRNWITVFTGNPGFRVPDNVGTGKHGMTN